MRFIPLRKPNPNKSWMKGFSIPKSRKDIPIPELGDHANSPGTRNFKSSGGRHE